jgi:hypothetical protein
VASFKFTGSLRKSPIGNRKSRGGEGGIRTHGTVSRTQHFQCCQFSHSCTSPKELPIVDCRFAIERVAFESQVESAIANRQSAITWRRGWDSNPRNPCGFNGFRDRPIQPLSHLSACYSVLRLLRKKDCSIRLHSPSRMPPSTLTRWFKKSVEQTLKWVCTAPAFGSGAP